MIIDSTKQLQQQQLKPRSDHNRARKTLFLAKMGLLLALLNPPQKAFIGCPEVFIAPQLLGIGYYEMADVKGIDGVSFAGGAEIVFYGQGMSHNPTNIQAVYTNSMTGQALGGPPNPIDVAFNSHTDGGKLKYTTSSSMDIHGGIPYEAFANFESMTYDVTLLDTDGTHQMMHSLKCNPNTPNLCRVTVSRSMTPIMHYLAPPVIYNGSEIAFWLDPRSAQHHRSTIKPEYPFVEVRLNGYSVEFEGYLLEDDVFSSGAKNQVIGMMGAIVPNKTVDVKFRFRVGYALCQDSTMLRCSYDNSTCYRAKAVGVIYAINVTQGYSTGGQVVKVSGHGFNSGDIQVKIDGVDCNVTSFKMEEFTCVTGAKETPSEATSYVGQHGIQRTIYNQSTEVTYAQMGTNKFYKKMLSMDLEAPRDQKDPYYGNYFQGYFKAPATARYRFYVTCDDYCQLWLSNVTMDPSKKFLFYQATGWSGYRNYFTTDGARVSKWINLTKDEYYYIELKHIQYTGGDHATVSLEIEDLEQPVDGHHHSMREIQRLYIDQSLIRDKTNITILNPDGGTFTLTFINPKDSSVTVSAPINTNGTAGDVYNAVRTFYGNVWSAPISVTKEMYDENDTLTYNVKLSVKSIFTISLLRSINQASSNQITVKKTSTSSITVTLPRAYQFSSPILKGSFKIKCSLTKEALTEAEWNTTIDLPTTSSTTYIRDQIIKSCPFHREKIEVSDGYKYGYYDDGRDINIRFFGHNFDVPQFQILNTDTSPVIGNELSFNSTTWVPYSSKNLFYQPLPYEFLYTEEKSPQVIVSVNGVEAVCDSLNCGYTYVQPTAVIDNFSYTDETNTLVITGSNFNNKIQEILFSNIKCTEPSINAENNTITCKVVPVAGSWKPQVSDIFGTIPFSGEIDPISIPLIVDQVVPTEDLNPFGGNVIVISGKNFPQSLSDGTQSKLSFSDGTVCDILETSSTEIKCLSEQFVSGTSSSQLILDINGVTNQDTSVAVSTGPATISSIVPSRISPVLKQILTLTVIDFEHDLDIADLEVSLKQVADPTIVRPMNVVKVVNEENNQQIVVKFGGSESGNYTLFVRSKTFGRFDTTSIVVDMIGIVTDFSPKKGSIHGGTLVTITGYEFSSDPQDNPVRMGYTDCLVEESSTHEIKCRTIPRHEEVAGTDDFLVFLKTYEEAKCSVDPCTFEWISDGLPQVGSYSVDFDETLKDYFLTITGADFGASMDGNTEIYIDDVLQTLIQADDTTVKVQIIDIMDSFTLNVDVYLPIGIPDGIEDLSFNTGVTLTPKLLSVSPNVGSPAGTIITATVKGVGSMTQNVTLIAEDGTDICKTVSIVSYGIVSCTTIAKTLSVGSLQVKVGSNLYPCSNLNGECNYATDDASMPSVTTISLTDAYKITFTGSAFDLGADFEPIVTYNNILADSVILDGSTSLIATFALGVPLSQQIIIPSLILKSATTTHWALIASTAKIDNKFTQTEIGSSLDCSFAGGCLLSINQAGLIQNLVNDPSSNYISVCGQTCTPSLEDSTDSVAKCFLPSVATTYSIDNYNIITEQYLTGTLFSSNSALTQTIMDGSHQNGWTSSASPCYFGTEFKAGYIGVLNEVKYYMPRFTKANFVGKLSFQGTNNLAGTWTTIFTVGQEIHEGWNYYNYEEGKELKYRYYRFYGSGSGSCQVGEISLRGFEVIDNSDPTFKCSASLYLNNTNIQNLTGDITYTGSLTPLLNSIEPRFGSVVGNQTVTFNGENFSTDVNDYTVLIDEKLCTVTEATETYFKCITSKRPGIHEKTSLDIRINGRGAVATQGLLFRYANLWSESVTWGGEFQPIEGDMVYVPKGLHLVVDVDSTPILSAVLVEGSLIFPPNTTNPDHVRTFDAHYVLVKGGYLEAGTEDFPYTSKLVITMYSQRTDPEIPIFGNKVIAMYNGILDMHGIPRHPTWTELDFTAEAGVTNITLLKAVDWTVGDRIIIAPTSYDRMAHELRTITNVDKTNPDKPIIFFNEPLEHKHFAGIQYFGADQEDFIEMRAEVGLLSRNILFRGDPETSAKNEYGGQIMVHSNGMETLIARIEYVEFFDCGQEFQLGRYPIHFHLIGAVHYSYIRGNAIHQSYNRATTIHGVHYLRVVENVAFNVKGHTFFIEDAAETKNLIENNLAIYTRKSWSLLNSDQTPASFWITHPDNIVRGNHAVSPDNYGFWYDTKPNPTGPSYDPNVCPENSPLGEFSNNVAHSTGRYGLRLFHKLIPRTYPCSDLIWDPKNTTDPYWRNPIVIAHFVNFTSYKNVRNGAIGTEVGGVSFDNFKITDNILANIEFEKTNYAEDGYTLVNGGLMIGYSDNHDETDMKMSHGIIGARTENMHVKDVKFYNFDKYEKAPLGSCSHCYFSCSTDSGARTVSFSGLYFDPETVPIRIRWQVPYREIFQDLDGSLTGLGPNSFATPYYIHNDQPECRNVSDIYDGLICNSSVQVRRIAFWDWSPDIFGLSELKVLRYDDSIIQPMDNATKEAYILDKTKYTIFPIRPKIDPMFGWAIPLVTGHKYKMHWQYGQDFTVMRATQAPRWSPGDKDIHIVMNFTDVRAKVDFLTGRANVENETIFGDPSQLSLGSNIVYNDTETREIHWLASGKNQSRMDLIMKTYRCVGPCLPAVTEVAVESNVRLWSNDASWPSGKVPLAGEDVVIEPGKNFVFDLEESPIYTYIQINGRVTFKEDAPKLHMRAKYVFVRAGELFIGNKTHPFKGQAQITLYGEKDNQHIVYDNAVEAGNKIIANTNLIQIYGKPRLTRTRLLTIAQPGDKQVVVEAGLSWNTNETLAFAPTRNNPSEFDYAVISSYNNDTGVVTLDRPLDFFHFGAPVSPGADFSGIDYRGEVVLLTRNVRIVGNDTENWGCQVVTSDFVEGNGEIRKGRTYMDNVEIYNCSQYDTYKSALRFEGANLGDSLVSNCAIHHGSGVGVEVLTSSNISLVNNTVYDFKKFGVNVQYFVKNITFDGNWVFGVRSRNYTALSLGDPMAAFAICAKVDGDLCFNLTIINNMAAGVESGGVDVAGYSLPGSECNNYKNPEILFQNNTAHSILGNGAIIWKSIGVPELYEKCIEASFFSAWKCQGAGIVSNQATDRLQFTNMVFADNSFSAVPMVGHEGENLSILMKNVTFYGEITDIRDCSEKGICEVDGQSPGCHDRSAIMLSSFTNHSKMPLIGAKSKWPQWKIKGPGAWGGNTWYDNIKFINFKSGQTWCGEKQRLIRGNPYLSDYAPTAKITNVVFENIDHDAIAYWDDAPEWWATIDDCGEWTCTGSRNILVTFEKSTYTGIIQPLWTESQFQLLANNEQNCGRFANCKRVDKWNGYHCTNSDLAIMIFESNDEDKFSRIITPIYVNGMNISSSNAINTFMDHQYEGFYTSMIRMSRYVTVLQGGQNMFYQVEYTSTPPAMQRFSLRADYTSVTIRIKYTYARAYIIKDYYGKEIKANGWDASISAPSMIKGSFCGENRYVGVLNILEFHLRKNCTINIEPIDSIQTSIRLNWTMNEFFADGGTTKFADRLAASLGIKAANIKIVSVYMGSVIVDSQILEDSEGTLQKSGGIDQVSTALSTKLSSGNVNLGAEILSVSVKTTKATAKATATDSAAPPKIVVGSPDVNTKTDGASTNSTNGGKTVITPIIKTNVTTVYSIESAGSVGNDGQKTTMIAVIGSILALIAIGGIVGYCVYVKIYKNRLIQQQKQVIETIQKPATEGHTPIKENNDALDQSYVAAVSHRNHDNQSRISQVMPDESNTCNAMLDERNNNFNMEDQFEPPEAKILEELIFYHHQPSFSNNLEKDEKDEEDDESGSIERSGSTEKAVV